MSIFFRHLLFLLIFLSVLSIERALGLPFISLVLASNCLANSERIPKTIGIIITGIFLAMSYLVPLWLGISIIAVLVFVLEHRIIILSRETLTYFGFVVGSVLLLGFVSRFPVSLGNVLYHVCLAAVCLFLIRFWSIKKTSKLKFG